MHPYNRININVLRSETQHLIRLHGMNRFAQNFAPWEQGRYHVAENGFVLASEHPKQVKCYPRIGKLSLPSEPWWTEWATTSESIEVYLDRNPINDLYMEFMIDALREYEAEAFVYDDDK